MWSCVDRDQNGSLVSTDVRLDPGLTDTYQRQARDLRISLTDRCNMRCSYCMPPEGVPWLPSSTLLSDDEVLRLAAIAVERLGIRRIRLTGGEPLLRPQVTELVSRIAHLRTDEDRAPEIALTTNGASLERHALDLAAAGLTRVNISLDSVDRERYRQLAGADRLPAVLRGLQAAKAAGLTPVKVNTVVMRDRNEADIVPLTDYCLNQGFQIRFIEQMPLGADGTWSRQNMVGGEAILAALTEHFTLTPVPGRGASPAQEWDVAGSDCHPAGRVGLIASVTDPFCTDCDRTRITADGQLRSCLFAKAETDLRALLRSGSSDAEIAQVWRETHQAKTAGHDIGRPGFRKPGRNMSAIGG